ncbi:HAMP domain-containing sensor histidine kinase [Actinoplanes aureus]|uniref:histidine kinase n=1 Tax=Actinoplanes aureus TaxID=2792083 RepID=A0A931G5R8_9ACTN|nr:HAMP domain-containing sensor histidine kinase [Actinoplanes aureus]MBG0566519.1 HAMP domain-containing histidine kinase [Actinoplanes aureus]
MIWRSLRTRFAVLGFLAIYVPVLLLFGVVMVSDVEAVSTGRGELVTTTSGHRTDWVTWTVLALAPVAAALAWGLAGRAVHDIDRVRAVAEDIEAVDLTRRVGLDRGPSEVVRLASSIDAMLGRLEQAAETQRRLIEEASHELRTPLAVLMANAEVLLAHPHPTIEVYRDGLRKTATAAARLQATVDELLVDARGRARTIARRPADLMAVVRAVADDVGVIAATKTIELSVTGPETAECAFDEPTVRRAVTNLVDNAVRYAPAGTTVEIRVETSAYEVAVVVTDHGAGIPLAEQEGVFRRFWRSRTDVAGSGLGLPIANQVALAHGGELTLASPGPDGDGCAFRLTLARAPMK